MVKCIIILMNVRILPMYVNCGFWQQQIYYSTSRVRNPYDVLGLKSTCSKRDVKKAYIKLCKELHPDMKPGNKSQHKKFIELNDAYTALLNLDNKKNSRRRASGTYENVWRSSRHTARNSQNYWDSEKAWYEREEYQQYYQEQNKQNKMNKNVRKANIWVIAGCFILMVLGSFLYVLAYRFATRYTKKTVDEKSKKISESYYDLQKKAMNNGKLDQLDKLKKKWKD